LYLEVIASMSQQMGDREIIQYMLDNKYATKENVKWGTGYRNIVVFNGKKHQYKEIGSVNKILMKSIYPLYIEMSTKVQIPMKKEAESKSKLVKQTIIKEKKTILNN
jgi:hypothetical protein